MRNERRIGGIGVSPGVAIGKAFLLGVDELKAPPVKIPLHKVEDEIKGFRRALSQAKRELARLRDDSQGEVEGIFGAHLMMLEDPVFLREIEKEVREKRLSVAHIFGERIEEVISHLGGLEDEHFRGRVADIRDVGTRVMAHLLGTEREVLAYLQEEVIVVAHDLSPSDTAQMRKERVIGFVTELGGRTSHTAIMARSLEIPAVVGASRICGEVNPGDMLVVDGQTGRVILRPSPTTLKEYRQVKARLKRFEKTLSRLRDLPAVTPDGRRVELSANIEAPEEAEEIRRKGGYGTGLFRTEYLFMRATLPGEDEQFEVYSQVVRSCGDCPVIIRTVDLGGDKFVSHFRVPREVNPFLGRRGIRLCLQNRGFFKIQLRAILRASALGRVGIMFPMVSGVGEVREAKGVVEEAKQELRGQGIEFDEGIQVGIMVEVPSAAILADLLAPEVNFFSIGTNDLTQYCLAVDRVNPNVSYLYEPLHPAVLKLINQVVEAGHRQGIWVGLCGELGADPAAAVALLGMGLDELSVSPMAIPQIKLVIRGTAYSLAQRVAKEVLAITTPQGIREYLEGLLKNNFPQLNPVHHG